MNLQEAVYCVHSFSDFFFCLFSSQTFQGHVIGHQFGLEGTDKVSVRDCYPFLCSGLNCVPFKKDLLKSYYPAPQSVTLYGNMVLVEVILENEMAAHSSILAWKIPWTEKPGRLESMGSQRVRHN